MIRNNLLFMLLLCLGSISLLGQNSTDKHHRTRVRLEGHSIQELAALGLEADHGEYVPGRHFTNDFSDSELRQLTEAGFLYEIIIVDVGDYYINAERRLAESGSSRGGDPCETDQPGSEGGVTTPSNFHLGSMAGFFTYDEMLDILDSMRLLYPHLISSRQIVSPSIITHDDRPIYWLRVSDNPDTDEVTEPEVLYTALHHAREPNGLSQMIYYLWYLLENYDSDPEIKYLVDNTELYFMPCVNPDGYVYNQETDPQGGGFWRKNRRDNDDGSFGVDLNRNYGYEWAFDDSGSSPNTGSQTYRGPAGFSEPETQAVAALCNEHEFAVALNYHTYGNLLIYPWGYSDSPTPDSETFNNLAAVMSSQNNYLAGTGTETVGYTVNGDSDDWMYGEEVTKPAIYSMTPEVGEQSGGFWPEQEVIIPNCRASLWMNIATANSPHVAGIVKGDPAQVEIAATHLFLRYEVQRFGFTDGDLTVSVSSLQDDLITVVEEPKIYNLDANANAIDSMALAVTGALASDTELRFVLSIDNGAFARTDTITRVFSAFVDVPAYANDFSDLEGWTSESSWAETTNDFVSAPSSLTDSPFGEYENNSFNTITLDESIVLGAADEYRLKFWAKWNIEAFYDWAQLQVSVNGGEWLPACGRYTVAGSEAQSTGQPVWEGQQAEWVEEEVDLTPLVAVGDEVRLRFLMVADDFVNPDGFYVDDLILEERNEDLVSTTNLLATDFSWEIIPNPAHTQTLLQFRSPLAENADGQWQLHNAAGQLLQQAPLQLVGGFAKVEISTLSLPAGLYWVSAQIDGTALTSKRLVIIK